MGRRVSPEMLRALELAQGGMTIAMAADAAGVSALGLKGALRRAGVGLGQRGGKRGVPDETVAKMRDLRRQAVPIKEIAQRFSVHYQTAYEAVRDITPASAGVWDISRRTINPGTRT